MNFSLQGMIIALFGLIVFLASFILWREGDVFPAAIFTLWGFVYLFAGLTMFF